MKFHEKIAAVVAFVGILPVSAAETYTWIPGSTDWASEDSYVEDGKPGQGDIVLIPSGQVATNKVVADDAASLASFEAFSKLHSVKLESNASKLVLDIGAGLLLTNNCRITCNAGYNYGLIEKRGGGELELGVGSDSNCYRCNVTVAEGILTLPQSMTMTASAIYLGRVVVSNGATLVTAVDKAKESGTGKGATMIESISGGGDITNRCTAGRRLGFNVASKASTFSGRICPRVLLWPASYEGVSVNLTGTESTTYEYVFLSYGATLGAAKFGLKGQPSSIGKYGNLFWRSGGTGGTFKYLGEGEDTTDKNFYVWSRGNSPVCIDGGNGGLTMTGTISWNEDQKADSYGLQRLTLSGDGPLTNVFAGTMPTWTYQTTNYCFHITKKGAGIWRFADKSQTHSGAWTVENGTLQFESLKQRGVACSLGTSKNCLESYTGLIDENKRVPWAFALGGATTPATLEYVGADRVFCTTRPILLKGKGGTLKNSSDKQLVFGGVSSAPGESVALTLAGDTAATNEIWNVTDGDGTTSLVKDGSGTWALCGTNNFSGSVTVKNGTLVVKNLSEFNYDWFRWTIKARNGTDSKNHDVRAAELGIYDASGNRMNGGLTTYAGYGTKPVGSLPVGMAGYGHPSMSSDQNSSRPLAALFDDGTPIASGKDTWTQMGYSGMAEIAENAESTWISVVMHLADNSARVKTFDAAQGNFSNYYAYKKFSMEGSLDGIHWDVLTNTVDATVGANYWSFSDKKYTAGTAATHTGGCPIAGGPEGTANALEGAGSSFSVAADAHLVAQGAATIPGLVVDADGAGTVEGFAFAESGTLVVNNLPRKGGALPGTYVNCTGLENVANWTLSNGDSGRVLSSWSISVKDGVITLIPPGAVLIVE